MLKIITGPPRAGKTYWAVRHLLLTYYRWDDDLFTWLPKDGKPLIITNIDGLRVEHENLEIFLKNKGVTLPELLTLKVMVPLIETEGRPVVLLLDEAHGVFPSNFKERNPGVPDESTLYFFGYHGHYPIDIYLITHSWTDLCQSIAQRAEYQIDAERRTMSMVGEFKYYYLHPKTQEKLNTQVVKSDKKIHMMYLSSAGEHKSNEIKPARKLMIIVALVLVVAGVLMTVMFSRGILGQKKKGRGVPMDKNPVTGHRIKSNGQLLIPTPPTDNQKKTGKNEAVTNLLEGPAEKQSFIQVSLTGAWVGDRVIAVDLFGDVVPLAELPYSYTVDKQRRRIQVNLPESVLAQLRPGLWVDGRGKIGVEQLSKKVDLGGKNEVDKPTSSAAPAVPAGDVIGMR